MPQSTLVRLSHRCDLTPILLAFSVAGGGASCGEPPLRPRPPSEGAPHFTVMSYNVELGAEGERGSLEGFDTMDADVLCLQEVTPAAEEVLRSEYTDDYPYQLYKSKGGAGGLAALSRFPLTDDGLRTVPEGWHPAWHLEAETPAGRVQILNVHLRSLFSADTGPLRSYLSTGEDHLAEIEAFSNDCETEVPTIVLGDFNEGVNGDAVNFLEERGYLNLLPAFRPGQPTWGFRSVADQLSETIDHILINDALVPLDAWVKRHGHSDHMPVFAHVQPRVW
jgi:endonuclease/exonuclease/phosphatase family metal-dependent hydrolase